MKIIRLSFYLLIIHFSAAAQEFSNSLKIYDPIYNLGLGSKFHLIPEKNYSFDRIISEDFNNLFLYKSYQKPDFSFLFNPFEKHSFHNKNDYFSFRAEPEYSFFSFDFHLKPLLKMNKTDVYFFGNFSLSEKRILNGNTISYIPGKRDLYWETGIGINYEFSEKQNAFLEYSRLFINQSIQSPPKFGINPEYYKAGIRYKF